MTQTARVPPDRIFRALSDRTRLRILHLLQHGELCVCDLVGVLKVPQPTASRHLAYLRESGLVRTRKQGSWSYYRLADQTGPFRALMLECLKACPPEMPEMRRDDERLSKRDIGCCD